MPIKDRNRRGGIASGRVSRRFSGFTLVELLVVISIIALLISILLPSLKNAREQAKTLKCMANLKSMSTANAAYGAEYDEWLVGAAGTTGGALLGKYPLSTQDLAVDMPEPPVQIWDYTGPLAAYSMDMTSLPPNRGVRWNALNNQELFRCPSNRYLAVPYPNASDDFKTQKMISYNTCRNFMMWPRNSSAPFDADITSYNLVGGGSQLPAGYSPRLNRVGQPSEKIYLADASRHTDPNTGEISYDANWKASFGGGFCSGSPTIPKVNLKSWHLTDSPYWKYSYRHARGKAPGIAAVYFDGHADWLSEKASRWPDPWWPKGSTIPANDFNRDSLLQVRDRLVGAIYTVPR